MRQLACGGGQAELGTLALGFLKLRGKLRPLPEDAARQPADGREVVQEGLARTGRHGLLPHLLLSTQVEQGIGQQPLSDLARPPTPGDIELFDLTAAQAVLDGGGGQSLTGLATLARQRHQGLQRPLHREPACPDVLLHRPRQDPHQRKSLRHPTGTAVKPSGKLLHPQTEAALKLRQKPTLFEGAGGFRHLQRPHQHQGVDLGEIPTNGLHSVASQSTQRTQALVAVDHNETPALTYAQGHRHDRYLLALLVQAQHQALLLDPRAGAQTLVAQVELMRLQLQHPGRRLCGLSHQSVLLLTTTTAVARNDSRSAGPQERCGRSGPLFTDHEECPRRRSLKRYQSM